MVWRCFASFTKKGEKNTFMEIKYLLMKEDKKDRGMNWGIYNLKNH
jgi:hypothetical protein